MTQLFIPASQTTITDFAEITAQLKARGVAFARWKANQPVTETDSQEVILRAYSHELEPYMKTHGFQSADVINVHPGTPSVEQIREKFLSEHTHSEDEVRFFVDGEGEFWFHFPDGAVVRLTCVKGDFLSVPKGLPHWFDLAPKYFVKAIRIFTTPEGWVANYTGSGVDLRYRS